MHVNFRKAKFKAAFGLALPLPCQTSASLQIPARACENRPLGKLLFACHIRTTYEKRERTVVALRVNEQRLYHDGDDDMPLLWFLRDVAGLKGTKFGCGVGACGACTVHRDGVPLRSCIVTIGSLDGAAITTIEGLSGEVGERAKQAWIAAEVPQCGYCQPGMIMAAAALLESKAEPDDAAVDRAMTNICRCGTYNRIRRAIRAAATGQRP
jgi:isoquinoline 1-oxidoreductase alpha subunit